MSDPLRRWSLVLSALVVFGLPIKARAQQQGQSTPCDGEDHLFAVTGSLPDTATALRRHEMLMVHLPTQASVVIIGDSLVQAWPQPLLDRLSPGGVVLNLGVGRDRIQNVIYRLQDPRLSASHLNPTYTVIWAGTNNLGTLGKVVRSKGEHHRPREESPRALDGDQDNTSGSHSPWDVVNRLSLNTTEGKSGHGGSKPYL